MSQVKLILLILVTLVIGFAGGFVLRPVILPMHQAETVAAVMPAAPVSSEARGTQYFEANIAEARSIVAGCRQGTVRGAECQNAATAIITVESKERFRRFRGER